ncbi:MAG: type II toxin-antitoxin system RelE/ParE family toxin [Rhodospirillaceae bacterium]|nr:type II toxin-antitoxin system RelE/ParE family toxin [Rhodospirillaceae bacterium]
MDVVFSPEAIRDLSSIEDWLRQPGAGKAAAARLAHIRQAIRDLSQFAEVWPRVGGAENRDSRKRVAAGHVIIYRIIEKPAGLRFVVVDAVFAPGRLHG